WHLGERRYVRNGIGRRRGSSADPRRRDPALPGGLFDDALLRRQAEQRAHRCRSRVPLPHGLSALEKVLKTRPAAQNSSRLRVFVVKARCAAFTAKGPSGNKVYILLLAPRPAGKARATSIPAAVCKERATQPAGLRAAAPEGRGGGRASAALPLLDDATTSPASRRLASARPALAPKCTPYFLTGP